MTKNPSHHLKPEQNQEPMTVRLIKDTLDHALFFSCFDEGAHIRISTPFSYPDGDAIDLFVVEREGKTVISDMGETIRYLSSRSFTIENYHALQMTALSKGVLLIKGVLFQVVDSVEDVPKVMVEVLQCALEISAKNS